MGKHYIPKYYLRGFLKSGNNNLWAYNRDGTNFEVALDNIAQETEMYSDETEKYLTENIENPANQVLDKVRSKEKIDFSDKLKLARYLIVLYQRTPSSYNNFIESTPDFMEDVRKEELQKIKNQIKKDPENESTYRRLIEKIDTIVDDFIENPPKVAWESSIKPEMLKKSTSGLLSMNWQFLFSDNPYAFLTSDDPFFYFKQLGIANPKAEVIFPISSSITLWATWRKDLKSDYIKVTNAARKEINYRLSSQFSRHLFYSLDKDWVKGLAQKKQYSFSFLR